MKMIEYFKDAYNELIHKVSWPTAAELWESSIVVMVASLIIAGVVFAMDFVFQRLVQGIYHWF
jgi:preprotein translocase subunit SecE